MLSICVAFIRSSFYLFFFLCNILQCLCVVGGGGFAENILKIEAWKPICQVEVCRRRSPGYRDTKLGCELSCPPRLILAGGAPRGSREGLNDHACMA